MQVQLLLGNAKVSTERDLASVPADIKRHHLPASS